MKRWHLTEWAKYMLSPNLDPADPRMELEVLGATKSTKTKRIDRSSSTDAFQYFRTFLRTFMELFKIETLFEMDAAREASIWWNPAYRPLVCTNAVLKETYDLVPVFGTAAKEEPMRVVKRRKMGMHQDDVLQPDIAYVNGFNVLRPRHDNVPGYKRQLDLPPSRRLGTKKLPDSAKKDPAVLQGFIYRNYPLYTHVSQIDLATPDKNHNLAFPPWQLNTYAENLWSNEFCDAYTGILKSIKDKCGCVVGNADASTGDE